MTATFTQVVPILRMFDLQAVCIETKDAEGLHRELHAKNYPFLNPALDPYGADGPLEAGLELAPRLRLMSPRVVG